MRALSGFLVLLFSWQLWAQGCSGLFTVPLQSHRANSTITMCGSDMVRIQGDNDGVLDFANHGSSCSNWPDDSCGSGTDCSISGQTGSGLTLPSFRYTSANGNNNVSNNRVLGQGSYNTDSYPNFRLNSSGSVSFSTNYDEYFFKNVSLDSSAIMTLRGGQTYWMEKLDMNSSSEIRVTGSGTAVLYILKRLTMNSSARINASGNADQLFIGVTDFQSKGLVMDSSTELKAAVYVDGEVTMDSSAIITGALSSGDLRMNSSTQIVYDSDAQNVDVDGVCTAQSVNFVLSRGAGSKDANTCGFETFTLNVEDDAGDPVTDYTGSVSFSTSNNQGYWFSADNHNDLTLSSPGDGGLDYTFHAEDNGQVSFNLLHTSAASLTVSVTDGTESANLGVNFVAKTAGEAWLIENQDMSLGSSSSPSGFHSISFAQTYDTPPIVLTNVATQYTDSVALRVRNVTRTGFEVRQVEAPGGNGTFGAIDVTYVAIEPGVHLMPDGSKLEACIIPTSAYQSRFLSGNSSESVSFSSGFGNAPGVISKIQTMANQFGAESGDLGEPWLTSVSWNVTNSQMNIAMERSETTNGSVSRPEALAYLAVEPDVYGNFTANAGQNVNYEFVQSDNEINGTFTGECTPPLVTQHTYSSPPYVVAGKNSRSESDGGWMRQCFNTNNTVNYSIDEDTSNDSERHHVSEKVGAVVFDEAFYGELINASCALDHFVVVQDSSALACPDAKPSVTVTAYCNDGSVKTDYTGDVSLSSASVGIDSNALSFFDAGSELTNSRYSFTGSDLGTRSFTFDYLNVASNLQVTATDVSSGIDGTSTTGTQFLAEALVISSQSNMACGSDQSQTLQVQAMRAGHASCSVLSGFSGNKVLKAWYQVDIDGDGVADDVATQMTLGGTNVDDAKPAANNLTLSFSSGSANLSLAYGNAVGRVLAVNLEHDQGSGSVLTSSSSGFVIYPDRFSLTTSSGCDENNPTACAAYTSAGVDFTLDVEAQCSNGQQALQYQQSGIDLSHTLVAPAGGDGAISVSSFNMASSQTSVDLSFNEVGVITLDAATSSDYMGVAAISGTSGGIGRFVPYALLMEVEQLGNLAPVSGSDFVYTGATNALGFGTVPKVKVKAVRYPLDLASPNLTSNYTLSGFFKLEPVNLTSVLPAVDREQTGTDGALLSVNGSGLTGFVDAADVPVGGEALLSLSTTGFTYLRASNSLINPFVPKLRLIMDEIRDQDGISNKVIAAGNQLVMDLSSSTETVRFGRLKIEDASGSEKEALTVPVVAEYYVSGGWEINTLDSETSLPIANVTLDFSATPALDGETAAQHNNMTSLLSGKGQVADDGIFQLTAPDIKGSLQLNYDVEDWLEFDWQADGGWDEDPSATAIFGIYSGHDKVIFRREGG